MTAEQTLERLAAPGTLVMGVLNVTPDSFSDGGKYLSVPDALYRAGEMLAEGADIIDIGGESTRPPGSDYGTGSVRITADEESARVLPVIEEIRKKYPDALISIDTTKSVVADRALALGANIINDVSGATSDPSMADAAARHNVPIVVMHGYGPEFDRTRIEEYQYDDVVGSVRNWLAERVKALHQQGAQHIIADIGFGFAKTMNDNVQLLKHLDEFTSLGVPLLIGVSRKSTIGKLLGGVPPTSRINGSIAAAIYAASKGAKIVRTHDVHQTKEAFRIWDALAA